MNRWTQSISLAMGMCLGLGGCTSSRSSVGFDFATDRNPTTLAGRGAPSLDDQTRPAAWIFVDGKIGTFKERDGQKLMQWFVDDPVGAAPTFRVEAFEPLLGNPHDFKCVLQTYDSPDGTSLTYAIRATPGMFQTGHNYDLLNPGSHFIIVDKVNNETLTKIPPLPPGTYGLAAAISNGDTGINALAVTYFTVGPQRAKKASVAGARNW